MGDDGKNKEMTKKRRFQGKKFERQRRWKMKDE